MTTQIISRFCGLLALTMLVSNSSAQPFNLNQLDPVYITGTSTTVTENIQVNFHKQFTEAENVRWFKKDRNYLVSFSMNDRHHSALLNRKGYLIYDICYGKEKHLPDDIRKSVKLMYVEYSISSANKVKEGNKNFWLISVEDDTNFAMVKVENFEMEEIQKFKKSKPLTKNQDSIVKQ
ncbi:MAG: hypothetical protein ABR503_16240 [Chitinophagaceae bacterium]